MWIVNKLKPVKPVNAPPDHNRQIDINTSLYQTYSQARSSSKISNCNDPQTSIQTIGHLLLTDFLHSCRAHSWAIQKVMGGSQRTY